MSLKTQDYTDSAVLHDVTDSTVLHDAGDLKELKKELCTVKRVKLFSKKAVLAKEAQAKGGMPQLKVGLGKKGPLAPPKFVEGGQAPQQLLPKYDVVTTQLYSWYLKFNSY